MLISPSPKQAQRRLALVCLCLCPCLCICALALAACSAPVLPDPKPTVQEVPFLGQQLTQQQIADWREAVSARRSQLQTDLVEQKKDCYQRFFTNTCLQKSQRNYRAQETVLHKQEIELNRQDRLLKEIDRQLRLQGKAGTAQ